MKKEQIENYFSKLFKSKVSILILKNQLAKKWYDKSYLQTDSISENIIYGVSIDRVICFDVKVSKIDNIFKTILTNYISKVMTKQHRVINGSLGYLTKEQCYEELKLNATKIRFEKNFFYTTIYGFGVFSLFYNDQTLLEITNPFAQYLKSIGIEYTNEYSDARWVFRFVTKKGIENHNKILLNFN